MTPDSRPFVPSARRLPLVCAGTALVAVCYGFARFAYGLFAPIFQDEFAYSSTLAGVIGSGSYVGYCIAIVISLVLTEKLGARPLAVAAGAVATTGTFVLAVAPNALTLAIGVLVAGSSTGLASPPLAAAVATWVGHETRDRSQTVVNAGTGFGVLLSGPIALLLTDHWRLAWALFSLICAAVTLWIAGTVPTHRPDRQREGTPQKLAPGTRTLLLAALLMGLASSATWTFGRALITTEGAATETSSTIMWTVIGVSGLAGAVSADLTKRLGLGRSWTAVLLAMAAATVALGAC